MSFVPPHTLRVHPGNIPQAHNLTLSVEQWQRATVGNVWTEEADLCLFWDFWSWISNKEKVREALQPWTQTSYCLWYVAEGGRYLIASDSEWKKLICFGYCVSHENKASTCLIGLNSSTQTIQIADFCFPFFCLVQTRTVTLQESTHPDEMPLLLKSNVTCMENSTNMIK